MLGVAMLAILAAGVLAAGWLVRIRQVPTTRAEDILRRIRQETLSASWGSDASTLWYLTQDAEGQPVGYVVRTRRLIRDAYVGWTLVHLGALLHTEAWSLDPSAAEGTYVARILTRPVPDTEIVLTDGRVTVTQRRPSGTDQATAPPPANYIPEGLLHRVIAEVAASRAQARFCTVWNNAAIDRGAVLFAPVTLTPAGDRIVRLQSRSLTAAVDDTYHLDAKGVVFRVDDNLSGTSTRLVEVRSLAKWFPEILDVQRDLEGTSPQPPDDAHTDEPPPDLFRRFSRARL